MFRPSLRRPDRCRARGLHQRGAASRLLASARPMARSASLVAIVIVTACAAGVSSNSMPPRDPVPTTATPTSIAADPRPVLTISGFAWNHPTFWWPRDLDQFAAYPSGALVSFEYTADQRLSMRSSTVDIETLNAWLDLADAAGLTTVGQLPAEQSPVGIIDGGYDVVTRRTAVGVGVIAIDQPEFTDAGATRRRGLLTQLIGEALGASRQSSTTVPVERWAIESAGPLASVDEHTWPWPDVDPSALSWSFNDAGVRCAIVVDDDWPYSVDEANDYTALVSGVFRRPLLPHELTCQDVFERREELGDADSIPRSPPGLPVPPP